MRIVDAWMQHPTREFLAQPIFASLLRWTRQSEFPEVPLEQTLAAMSQAGVEKGLVSAWWAPAAAIPNC